MGKPKKQKEPKAAVVKHTMVMKLTMVELAAFSKLVRIMYRNLNEAEELLEKVWTFAPEDISAQLNRVIDLLESSAESQRDLIDAQDIADEIRDAIEYGAQAMREKIEGK